MSTPSLRNKVILVTGASSGIGRAIAQALAPLQPTLVLCARRKQKLEELAQELRTQHEGLKVEPLTCNLRDDAQVLGMFARIRERFGGVEVLINNAGLGRKAPLLRGDTQDWREMLEVNVLALMVCAREAASDMIELGRGHIVNISSMASHRVTPEGGAYCATKFAVRALTEGLRQELHAACPNVRVSAVSPGFVETEFASVHAHGDPDAGARTYSEYPCLQPEDIAKTVHFVLTAPAHMQVHDILLRPTQQPL